MPTKSTSKPLQMPARLACFPLPSRSLFFSPRTLIFLTQAELLASWKMLRRKGRRSRVRQLEQADIFSGDEFKHGVGVAARRNIKTKSEKVCLSCSLLLWFHVESSPFFGSFALTWVALLVGSTLT